MDTSDWVALAEIMRKHINEDNLLAVVSECENVYNVTKSTVLNFCSGK